MSEDKEKILGCICFLAMGCFFAGFAIREYRSGKIIIRDYKRGRKADKKKWKAVDGGQDFRFIYKDKSPIEFRFVIFGRILMSIIIGITPLLLKILSITGITAKILDKLPL